MRATDGPFPFEGAVDLEAVDGNARVTNAIDAGSDSAATTVIFAVLGPVVRWLMGRRLAAELEDLAAAVESDATARSADAPARSA